MLPERAARVEGAEQAAVLKQRDGAVDEPLQVTARLGGREVEAVDDAVRVPVGDQFGEVHGAAPVQRALHGLPGAAPAVPRLGRVLAVAEVDEEAREDAQGVGVASELLGAPAELFPYGGGLRGTRRPDEDHVGVPGRGAPGVPLGGVDHADGVALRGRGTIEGPFTEKALPVKST